MKHLMKWVAFSTIALFILFTGVSPAAAQDGEGILGGTYNDWMGVGALVVIAAMLIFVFFHEWDSNRRAERMIDIIQRTRNDTDHLDRMEALAVKVVPADLVISIFNLAQALTTTESSRQLIEEIKGLIVQITDGLPNEPAHPPGANG